MRQIMQAPKGFFLDYLSYPGIYLHLFDLKSGQHASLAYILHIETTDYCE